MRTYTDPAEKIELMTGEKFAIGLDSNWTTGYSWKLVGRKTAEKLKLLDSRYQPAGKAPPGAGGKEIWIFQAVEAGKVTLSLEYIRRWGKDRSPLQSKSFMLILRKDKKD